MNAFILVFFLAIPLILLIFGGLIVLQVWLSKKPNRYLGLILPGLSFLLSLVVLFGLLPYGAFTGVTSLNMSSDYMTAQSEQLSNDDISTHVYRRGVQGMAFNFSAVIVLILLNIPTAVFLIIYFVSRRPFKKKKELNRMQIEDL